MIPRTIHYCWFGNNKKSELIEQCIISWKKHNPSYKVQEWNEENFDITSSPFTKRMYEKKKWAFVSDYVRLVALQNEGGFYLDTDMLLLKPLDDLLNYECVLGEESPSVISAGMIGAVKEHPYIIACKDFYDRETSPVMTIPRALTEVYKNYSQKDSIKVYPPEAFYPYDGEHIHLYKGQGLSPNTYGVHLWNYSWGHPLNKVFKKIGIYRYGKKLVEILGIKKVLKRLLGFI